MIETPEDLNTVVQCVGCGLLKIWSLDPAHNRVGDPVKDDCGELGGCDKAEEHRVIALVPSAHYPQGDKNE